MRWVGSCCTSFGGVGGRAVVLPGMVHCLGRTNIGRQIRPISGQFLQAINFATVITHNLATWYPAIRKEVFVFVVVRVRSWRRSELVNGESIAILTSRYIIRHPEHVRYSNNKNKIVEVKLRGPPFRRLCNWLAPGICPHANTRDRIISFGCIYCRVDAGIYYCFVWSGRGARKSRVYRVESVDAPHIGEETHRGDI